MTIPFNKPYVAGQEMDYMREAMQSPEICGDGAFSKKCSQLLAKIHGSSRVLLTPSCTHALEMCGLLLDLGPGDEVIVPSFTFVSTVNAFALRGARPVFVDIRPDTLNIDESLIEDHISPRTKAIVVVHYAGVGCEMSAICRIARKHGLVVIEDSAHAIGAGYGGKPLGSFGEMATLSFHQTKNIMCGEGGALLLNDERYLERAEVIREKGTNRSRFFRGEVDKYTWVDVGSSYLLSDILAAYLYAQLEKMEEIRSRRLSIFGYYNDRLADLEAGGSLRRPIVPAGCEANGHLFYVLMADHVQQRAVIRAMKERGIHCPFHYQPLHLSPAGRRYGYREGELPVTERVAATLLRVPLHNGLEPAEMEQVADALVEVVTSVTSAASATSPTVASRLAVGLGSA